MSNVIGLVLLVGVSAGLLLLFLVFAAIVLSPLVAVWVQGRAVRQAYRLLQQSSPDQGEVGTNIAALKDSRDEECRELVRRLMARLREPES